MLDNSVCVAENFLTNIKREYRILAEYKMILSEAIPGIYTIPSNESSLIWNAVIFVRKGCYMNGVFRFNISLSENFPNDNKTPVIIFQQDSIFHPLVNQHTGVFDISDQFSKWETSNHLWQLLKYMKFLLEDLEVCMNLRIQNMDAYDLFKSDSQAFYSKVKKCVEESEVKIFEPLAMKNVDKHYITFDNFNPDVHKIILREILSKDTIEMGEKKQSS